MKFFMVHIAHVRVIKKQRNKRMIIIDQDCTNRNICP